MKRADSVCYEFGDSEKQKREAKANARPPAHPNRPAPGSHNDLSSRFMRAAVASARIAATLSTQERVRNDVSATSSRSVASGRRLRASRVESVRFDALFKQSTKWKTYRVSFRFVSESERNRSGAERSDLPHVL